MSRMRKTALFVGGALALVAVLGWIFQDEILLSGIAFAAQRRLPVGPNHPIVWERGADSAGRPPGARPPNIVLIVADDLGWNDFTFGGGGVAGGSVPTPNIDSIARDGVALHFGLLRQRHLRALARRADDGALRHALRLRVHADAAGHELARAASREPHARTAASDAPPRRRSSCRSRRWGCRRPRSRWPSC